MDNETKLLIDLSSKVAGLTSSCERIDKRLDRMEKRQDRFDKKLRDREKEDEVYQEKVNKIYLYIKIGVILFSLLGWAINRYGFENVASAIITLEQEKTTPERIMDKSWGGHL